MTTLTHAQLVEAAYRWALAGGRCGAALREMVTTENEIPDVIGFRSSGDATVIECKASRADFLKDGKKPFRKEASMGMGRYRFYCAPLGLLKREEMPHGWGLLEVGSTARVVRTYVPEFHKDDYEGGPGEYRFGGFRREERNTQGEASMMYSALRRVHLRGFLEAAQVTLFDPMICEKCSKLPVAPLSKIKFCAFCGHDTYIKQRT